MASQPVDLSTPIPAQAGVGTRLASIDALRGIVMALMLVDHMRETIYLHMQVGDPVDVTTVEPTLFFTRLTATVCAPAFIALTGLSAWLYSQTHSLKNMSSFLLKRGLFLVGLEITVINFAWTGQLPPEKIYLQVIWCIGLCMIALAALIHVPRALQIALSALLIAGHHVLDHISFAPSAALYVPWAILHDRGWVDLTEQMAARTSYPVLPWVGIILLGYLLGPLFGKSVSPEQRARWLWIAGLGSLAAFALLRFLNVYGDFSWSQQDTLLSSSMAFLSLTKYPPSLLFSLLTLGLGAILLSWLIRRGESISTQIFAPVGAAPMFFYILHLYILKLIYVVLVALFGTNKGQYFGVDHVWMIWAASAVVLVVLYRPTVWFARLKQQRRDIGWLRYL